MPENVSAALAIGALAALLVTTGFFATWYCHVAHDHKATVGKFTWCLFCLALAVVWRRGEPGRHRMRDKHHLQRFVRSDWRELTPDSLRAKAFT